MKTATTYWQACLQLARAQERELAAERNRARRRHGAAARAAAAELDPLAEFHELESGGAS